MEGFLTDLRYGAKMLLKSKALTIVAVASLAVGIGANTAIFSIVNSIMLRPRPVLNPEQIVELYTGDKSHPYETTSYPSYLDFREHNNVFSGLAAYSIDQFKLGGANQVEQLWGETVSGNYFEVLGIQPFKGRMFLAEDDLAPGKSPVVVLSYELWQRRFNSDPEIISKAVTVNNQQLTVIGVAPPQYTGMIRGLAIEVWVPAMMMPQLEPTKGANRLASRGSRWVTLVGRLTPETTIRQAQARFDLLSQEMGAAHPEEWRAQDDDSGSVRQLSVSVLSESETRIHPDLRTSAYALIGLLFVIVNIVLLIACMNLANMLLARAVVRRREIAVRQALGASRPRIIRQLLTESLMLSLIAGAAGFVLAVWLLGLLISMMPALPEGVRVALDLRVDWRVLIYTVAFSTANGLLFGLAPALRTSRSDLSAVLNDDSGVFSSRHRRSRVRMSLVVAQVAFSLLLLVGAGLVLRSLERIRPTRMGFSSANILVAPLVLDDVRYDRARSQEFYRQLSERVAVLPGVQAVSLVDGMPGGFMGRTRGSIEVEGYQARPDESLEIDFSTAGPHYFSNMKMPFLLGRDFDERDRDGAPCVTIINEAFAKRYFPEGGSPLGKRLAKFESDRKAKQMCEIVGVIRDNDWQSLEKGVHPFYAMPLQQSERKHMTLLVSSAGEPASLTTAVRRTIQELDPNLPVSDVQPLRDYFSVGLYPYRLLGAVMGVCGLVALLLASIGIYGVVSYSVAQRTRELGIRIALGALQKDILKMVLGQGMVLVVYGLGTGLLLALALTRILASSVFELDLLLGISATDSLTFAGVTLLLALVALLASYVPARRATKVDPLVALRYE
jgi:macrolide transport system ATP-binding/permease protein